MMMFKSLLLVSTIYLVLNVNIGINQQVCDKAIGSLFKGIATPRNVTLTNAQGISTRTIFTNGKLYAKFQGKWSSFDFDPNRAIVDAKESLKFAHPDCRFVGNEQIRNVDAAVYEIITHEDTHDIYHKIWINSAGLPLEISIDDYEQDRKVHSSQSFDYNNVKAPF